jgi:signal transduction histidine kinase/phage shock protein PspC (stress-responsive transcriptional regulator)
VILDRVSTGTPQREPLPPDGRPDRPPLVRRSEGRLLAGVATGVATHLGVPVAAVRVIFALLTVNGIGPLAYIGLWLLVPADDEDPATRRSPRTFVRNVVRRRPGDDPRRPVKLLGYLLLGIAAASLLGAFGLNVGGHSILPLSIAGIGALLIWWRAPEAQRDQWSSDARRYRSKLGRRGPVLIVLGGIALVVVGVTSFLAAHDALAQARNGALAIGATLIGVLLVAGPWLFRLVRELTAERRARIREHERAELAAHVHDSVLQTLALIQAQAGDGDAVRRLARRQERELRNWLYTPTATNGDGSPTFSAALHAAAADVEDAHGVTIDIVVVGDAELDEPLTATVAAAREGMVNAAKSSGTNAISLFAEVSAKEVEVFVRDRGHGFDPDHVPDDRRGIRDSIVGRMARHGGKGSVRSGPTGTEVALSLGRKSSQ